MHSNSISPAPVKPDCYKCQHRGVVAGSAHSSCKHPAFKAVQDDPLLSLLSVFASVGRVPGIAVTSDACKVKGNKHGVRSGWFNHPLNFDPVWLEECSGFETKGE